MNTQVYFRNHYSEWACTGRPDLRSRTRIRHYSAVPYGTDMHLPHQYRFQLLLTSNITLTDSQYSSDNLIFSDAVY